MWVKLVAELIKRAIQKTVANKGVMLAVGGAAVADVVNIDWLRQEALRIAPGSDQQAIVNAADTAARLLGLGGDEILWPRHTRGPNAGEAIIPRYLTIDLGGQPGKMAWFHGKYYSRKSVNAAFMRGSRRGGARGYGRAMSQARTFAKP